MLINLVEKIVFLITQINMALKEESVGNMLIVLMSWLWWLLEEFHLTTLQMAKNSGFMTSLDLFGDTFIFIP